MRKGESERGSVGVIEKHTHRERVSECVCVRERGCAHMAAMCDSNACTSNSPRLEKTQVRKSERD